MDEGMLLDLDDNWVPFDWYGDDVPHDPDRPPPKDRLDRRDSAIEGTGRNREAPKWRRYLENVSFPSRYSGND